MSAAHVGRTAAAAIIAALTILLLAPPAEAVSTGVVGLAAYRIPDRFLSRDTAQGSIGYGYPPAYGFDTADHNVQCYIAPGEDSSPFACGVNTRAWKLKGRGCTGSTYSGVLGFTNAAYGSGPADGICQDYPIVPRQRRPGSRATTSRETNTVLPAGSTIRYRGVTCTASGSGRSTAVSCIEADQHHGFRISSSKMTTF